MAPLCRFSLFTTPSPVSTKSPAEPQRRLVQQQKLQRPRWTLTCHRRGDCDHGDDDDYDDDNSGDCDNNDACDDGDICDDADVCDDAGVCDDGEVACKGIKDKTVNSHPFLSKQLFSLFRWKYFFPSFLIFFPSNIMPTAHKFPTFFFFCFCDRAIR